MDSAGRLISIEVDVASEPDGDAGIRLARAAHAKAPTIRKCWVDAAYRGGFVETVGQELGWDVAVVSAPKAGTGFQVHPRRWVVERTFGWLGRYRRLSKDDAEQPESSVAWIHLSMAHILLRRLAPS